MFRNMKTLFVVTCLALTTGCASLVSGFTGRVASDLADTILNSRDIATVRDGVPAYLLMIDSFLIGSPDDPELLLAASTLYGSFTVFVDEPRAKLLTDKAIGYALHAACIRRASLCAVRSVPFAEFKSRVDDLSPKAVPLMYALGTAWAGWISAHADDWNAVAELARVKYLMSRIVDLDETWDNGGPHLYMGALETILPAAMGGNPEVGRQHFERAIEIAGGTYLMTKVFYAEQYARMVFDRDLHDRLLQEVIAADPVQPGMTLSNMVAQERAGRLLAESEAYF